MIQAVADRLAEVFAEYLHKEVRKDIWGYSPDEDLSNDDLIREKYQGIRPAWVTLLAQNIQRKARCGSWWTLKKQSWHVTNHELRNVACASVSGMYFHTLMLDILQLHIQQDQVDSYADRKGWDMLEAEKWLGPNIN